MALDALILSLLGDVADKYEKKEDVKRDQYRALLDRVFFDYINNSGETAKDWLRIGMQSAGRVNPNLDDALIEKTLDLIAKGHLSVIPEFITNELIQKGTKPFNARVEAGLMYMSMLTWFTYSKAPGMIPEFTALQESKKEIKNLTETILFNQHSRQRLICIHCYRVLREWDTRKTGVVEKGPAQVQCQECNGISPTYFKPKNKKETLEIPIW